MATTIGALFEAIARERDPDRLLHVTVTGAAELFRAPIAVLVACDPRGNFSVASVGTDVPTIDESAFEQVWSASRPGDPCFEFEGHRGVLVLLREGAETYVNDELSIALAAHIGLAWVAANERQRARATDSVHRTLVEQLPAITYYRAVDKPGIPSFVSPQIKDILGYEPAEVLADRDFFRSHVHPDDHHTIGENQPASRQVGDRPVRVEYRLRHRDGSYRWVHNHALSVRTDNDAERMVVGVIVDVTERHEHENKKRESERHIEEQLRQTQKLDAVGRLAGGVAHDFNNLLGVILGYTQLLLRRGSLDEKSKNDLAQITDAAERAKWLTAQLLSLSGLQVRAPRLVDVGDLIGDLEALLSSMLGADIELTVRIEGTKTGFHAMIDPGELQQVIINLVSNARDACERAGAITIRVTPSTDAQRFDLEVRDSGTGMDAKTTARIFEPFFTTKERGKGTGLGLSMVKSVVEEAGGTIAVESSVGKGTTFRVSLPREERPSSRLRRQEEEAAREAASRGRGTILVVDDEPALRRLLCRVLTSRDFSVLEAANGEEALRIAADNPGCDLLLTDVVMPGMSGRELYDELSRRGQALPVLFMSGYTDDTVFRHGVREAEYTLLAKPFTPEKLFEAVHRVLARANAER